jgi:hypothetical protein
MNALRITSPSTPAMLHFALWRIPTNRTVRRRRGDIHIGRGRNRSGVGASIVADWYGVDASASMIAAVGERFPSMPVECAARWRSRTSSAERLMVS